VAEAILRAASGEEPRLRVSVGEDALNWSAARFKDTEEDFIRDLARKYGWDRKEPGAGSRKRGVGAKTPNPRVANREK